MRWKKQLKKKKTDPEMTNSAEFVEKEIIM